MGHGWCARADGVGKVRMGTDRKQWVVTMAGVSKRWARVAGAAARSRRAGLEGGGDSGDTGNSGNSGNGRRSEDASVEGAGTSSVAIAPAFAIVRCGYTERLLTQEGRPNSEMQQVMESSDEVELVFVAGDGEVADFVSPMLPKRLERRTPGEIVIRVRDATYKPLAAIFSFIENLMAVYHCGFFRVSTLSEMRWNSRGRVLTIAFDTEAV